MDPGSRPRQLGRRRGDRGHARRTQLRPAVPRSRSGYRHPARARRHGAAAAWRGDELRPESRPHPRHGRAGRPPARGEPAPLRTHDERLQHLRRRRGHPPAHQRRAQRELNARRPEASTMEPTTTRRYSFRRKRYGWGWGLPLTCQGWVVLVLYFAAIAFIAVEYPPSTGNVRFVAIVGSISVALVLVCWLTGEPPHGRSERHHDR